MDDAEGFELSWYASQEMRALLARHAERLPPQRGTDVARSDMDAITHPPAPANEPIRTYAPGQRGAATASPAALDDLSGAADRADA